MSVYSRPSMKYQDGMELRDRKMTKDCTQPLRIGNIRALNGCAGRLFAAATLHNHKNSANKSKRKAKLVQYIDFNPYKLSVLLWYNGKKKKPQM